MREPSIPELGWAVARDVNRTVGGGYASMELLRRTFVRKGWLDDPGNALIVAVSRLTPGTNILAFCVALGWRLRGAGGAVTTLIAGSLPASIVVAMLTATVARVDRYRGVQVALAVGSAIAVILVFAAAWNLLRPYIRRTDKARASVIVMTTAGLLLLDVTPVRTLLVAAAVGMLVLRPAAAEGRPR
jgi:chromate transporter